MIATVYSVTRLHAAAEPFEQQLPFQLAIVELEDSARTTVRIIGPNVQIGDRVQPDPNDPNCWRLLSQTNSGR
jgi:uncharacterized OB-fold protein